MAAQTQQLSTMAHGHASRGDHTLNVRMLWFRGRVEREEPAMLALDLLSRDRADDALDVIEAALERTPNDPELLVAAARAHLMRGSVSTARDVCILAARESRDWPEAFAWLARILVREGRGTKAAEVAERAVLLGATDRDLLTIEAPRRAARLLSARFRAFMAKPDADEPALLALTLESAGRFSDALAVVELGLSREPGELDLLSIRRRLKGGTEDLTATSVDVQAADDELDEEAREEAFFASLRISTKPVLPAERKDDRYEEPSVIVSDTMVGEPAPRVHATKASSSMTAPIPLTQLAPRKRSGWLPRLGERAEPVVKASGDERLPGMPPKTVRTAPIARVARRDPTIRFWTGLR